MFHAHTTFGWSLGYAAGTEVVWLGMPRVLTVLDGVLEGQDSTLGLSLVSDVRVLLAHTHHHTLKQPTNGQQSESRAHVHRQNTFSMEKRPIRCNVHWENRVMVEATKNQRVLNCGGRNSTHSSQYESRGVGPSHINESISGL